MADDLGLAMDRGIDPDEAPGSVATARAAIARELGCTPDELTALTGGCAGLIRLLQAVPPEVFPGDLHIVTAEDDLSQRTTGPQAWRPFVRGDVHVEGVPCGHFDMLKAGPAARIGALLATWLDGR